MFIDNPTLIKDQRSFLLFLKVSGLQLSSENYKTMSSYVRNPNHPEAWGLLLHHLNDDIPVQCYSPSIAPLNPSEQDIIHMAKMHSHHLNFEKKKFLKKKNWNFLNQQHWMNSKLEVFNCATLVQRLYRIVQDCTGLHFKFSCHFEIKCKLEKLSFHVVDYLLRAFPFLGIIDHSTIVEFQTHVSYLPTSHI